MNKPYDIPGRFAILESLDSGFRRNDEEGKLPSSPRGLRDRSGFRRNDEEGKLPLVTPAEAGVHLAL